ncbi:MAG: hypothetical protein EOO68_06745 [Moraxellaceae bacterium]|nr:MAG: hypothetical protein EOO68_06745 [Moraxellaceae bacterium]
MIPAVNQWATQEIAIADLVKDGLNASKITLPFSISPTWDKQTNVNFQLDNIRWEVGNTMPPDEKVPCYKQPFETWGLTYKFDFLGGSADVMTGALTQIIAQTNIRPNWSSSTDKFGFAPFVDSTFANCAFADGIITAQIGVTRSYVNDGKMNVGFYYEDANQKRAFFPPISASTLKADDWVTITTPLSAYDGITLAPFSAVDPAFDPANITNVGIYFDANGKESSVQGEINIDNIAIIKQN